MNKYAVGKNIKLYCRMQNKGLDQLAEEIGVSLDTISRWCSGRRQITSHGLYRVSKALGVPMERLMEGIEDVDKLPSARPAFDARDTQYNLPIGKDVPDINVGDTISRQQAIDDIWTVSPLARLDRKWVDRWLRQLPPIQPKLLQPWEVLAAQAVLPQPKMGKWIYHIDDLFPAESTMECNQCHAEQPLTCDDEFCPHCGAKMEVTE